MGLNFELKDKDNEDTYFTFYHSNVNGGMGIFGSVNSGSTSVKIGTYPMKGKIYIDANRQ